MKIYLIRHGETDWNKEMRFQGREDIPLNAAGMEQARVCGRALRGLGIKEIYTSPLKRAARTGALIAEELGIGAEQVHAMPELIERDFGEYSGKYVKDRKDYFAIAAGEDRGNMETFAGVQVRMEQALRLLAQSGKDAVAAVSHGGAINVLLAELSGGEFGTGKTKLVNGSITVLSGNEKDGFRIEICNYDPQDGALHI